VTIGGTAWTKFIDVGNLSGNAKPIGPKMDYFSRTSYEPGVAKGRVADLVDAMRAPAGMELFASTGSAIVRSNPKSPVAMERKEDIDDTRTVLLKQSDEWMKRTVVDWPSVR